jgi:hypothetical protein
VVGEVGELDALLYQLVPFPLCPSSSAASTKSPSARGLYPVVSGGLIPMLPHSPPHPTWRYRCRQVLVGSRISNPMYVLMCPVTAQ